MAVRDMTHLQPLPGCLAAPEGPELMSVFPSEDAVVLERNYSLPTVIPKPVSSYFPKAPLKSTFPLSKSAETERKCMFFFSD